MYLRTETYVLYKHRGLHHISGIECGPVVFGMVNFLGFREVLQSMCILV